MEDLTQGSNTSTTRGTDHTPIMVPYIADITADHSPTPVHAVTEAAALEGTPMFFFQPPQLYTPSFGQWMLPLPFKP